MSEPERPDPDEMLARVKREEIATTGVKLPAIRFALRLAAVFLATGLLVTCSKPGDSVLDLSIEAKRLAGELRVLFTQATRATNLAVMTTKDQDSSAFARDAAEKTQRIQAATEALQPILKQLSLKEELEMLGKFEEHFAAYQQLDHEIIGLTVENTNLKAQRLSVGAVHEAAEAFRVAAEALVSNGSAEQHVLALTAVAALREIEILEAPHIAEASDEEMARLESQMREAEQSARRSLQELIAQAPAEKASSVRAAEAALNRFFDLHAQVIGLSRRNSNVRSLGLALGQKLMLTAQCEDDLRALSEALDKHRFVATR